jgi:hypothetical protein
VNSKEIKRFHKKSAQTCQALRVTDDSFRLKNIDPGDTLEFTSEDKPRAKSWPRQNEQASGVKRQELAAEQQAGSNLYL